MYEMTNQTNPALASFLRLPMRVTLPQPTMRELFQTLGFSYANYGEGWDYQSWVGWMNGTEAKPEIK